MAFVSPSCYPPLPDLPDSITVGQFVNSEAHGRRPFAASRNPYTCGLTGKTYSCADVARRVDCLARALGRRLGISPAEGTEWDRVVAIYSLNTIDYVPLTHALHRLSGIATPASAAYSASELEHQLRSSGAKALFTCVPLLNAALTAADAAAIPRDRVFLLPLPDAPPGPDHASLLTFDQLVAEGHALPPLAPLSWVKGQAARQTAYLCYSSGTSGLPKAVKISHFNVIANIVQFVTYDASSRHQFGVTTRAELGVLPLCHIFGLVMVAHVSQYCGDCTVILPRFTLTSTLSAIEKFQLSHLNVVPPMLIQMLSSSDECAKYDLSSVKSITSGAAPLGIETIEKLLRLYPTWRIGQGYGMTESSPCIVTTNENDIFFGSSGSLLPGIKAKLIDAHGNQVTTLETPGELFVQSPSIVLGYLNNEKANAETFVWDAHGRWLKTGDEVLVRKSPQGNQHFFITDRIKELIKVKGHQVAPAELEAHLLSHPFVSDCAVISVPDDRAGEVPKAFVVQSPQTSGKATADVITAIKRHVEDQKARHKWLKGGVELVPVIPKSASGKILRRVLKEKEAQLRRNGGSKL
ncbi:hypothetical protein CDD81_7439 [Ophiocordyceps australis]|uniref:AMP-dependent synthetase/ligase domain-containing protein n=1 Tax=Ophiocordyceps australis TaxID=1399860 RepID=A0A2C5YHC0_9HYPO|nr:hypothetical protein CDD81_7439 [Ophiocordyceps australis]